MTDPVGWGVVGVGERAREVMIPALVASPASRVVAACGSDPQKAREAASDWPDVKICADIAELVAEPGVEIIYISTPHFLHVPQAVQALDSNKHVFMESPMALSVDGAHKLLEKSRKNMVKLGVAFQHRYHPAMHLLHEKVQAGELGPVRHLTARCTEPMDRSQGWWCDSNRSGPVAVLRLGVHAFDLAAWISRAKVTEVMAMGVEKGEERINTMVSAVLRFEDNSLGYAIGATVFDRPEYSLRVEGEKGWVLLQGDFNGRGPVTMIEEIDGQGRSREFGPQDPVRAMVDEFVRAVRNESEYHPDGADGKKVVEITCAVIESMKARRAVKAGEILRLT